MSTWHETEWYVLYKKLKSTIQFFEEKELTTIGNEQHDIRMRLDSYRKVLKEMEDARNYHEDN